MGERKTIKRVVETDEGILYDLYRFRIMTREQIERLYFRGSKAYTYRKMYILRNSGYIQSKIIMRAKQKGRERTAIYTITDKGIRLLRERGLIDEDIEAKDLRIERQNMEGYLDFNDLYVALKREGYTFLDSRALKKKYQMERGDLCKGAVVTEDGREYLVYIVRAGAKDQTLRRIMKEMNRSYRQMGKRHNLVLFRGLESFDAFRTMYLASDRVFDTVCALPYTYALNVLKRFKTDQEFVKTITKCGKVEPNRERMPEEYKRLFIFHNGEKKYAVNLLMNDLTLMDRMRRDRLDRKAVLFVYEAFADRVREYLTGVQKVEIIEITDKELRLY